MWWSVYPTCSARLLHNHAQRIKSTSAYGIVKTLAEHEAKQLLRNYGIPTTRFEVIERREDLENLNLAYPVALKVSSPRILHKTEMGAVVLNIPNRDELARAYETLQQNFPGEVCMVEEMAEPGIELIAGIVDDRAFGPCIMVGMGGIFAEVYQDVSFRMLPITRKDAEEMLDDLRARPIFHGYRVQVDRNALISLLMKLSDMAGEIAIHQFDLNPIFLYERGVRVIDAKGMIGG